jgi:hypothetical protein
MPPHPNRGGQKARRTDAAGGRMVPDLKRAPRHRIGRGELRWPDETVTRSFAILTTMPNAEMSELDRMLVISSNRPTQADPPFLADARAQRTSRALIARWLCNAACERLG